jgi:membrane protein DedA with SNARE-associated domain
VTGFVSWLGELPHAMVYLGLALGACAENLVPAVPADTFVALGGVLAGTGALDPRLIFLLTWAANVGGALFVYRMSLTHGPVFFASGVGRHLFRPHQIERMGVFYQRFGPTAIFLSRFLPGFRAIVPVFAGVTRQPASRVVLPLASASAIWYGGLVYLGLFAGRNLALLDRLLGDVNRWLLGAAVVLGIAGVAWWIHTRRGSES